MNLGIRCLSVHPMYLVDRACRLRLMMMIFVEFMAIINRHVQEHPILVDKYLMGKEVEVDAVCDGEDILIPGIMEHVERAGIHSGDSISVYPAMSIKPEVQEVLSRLYEQNLHNPCM